MSTVDGDNIPFTQNLLIATNDCLLMPINTHIRRAYHAGQAETAPNHGGMARNAATFGKNRNHRMHTSDIFWTSFTPHQHGRLTPRSAGLSVGGCKDDLSSRRPRACSNALGQYGARRIGGHLPVQQLRQCLWVNTHQRVFARNDPVAGQIYGDMHRCARRPHDTHRIQNRQLATLECKLNLHLFTQALPSQHRIVQKLCERFRAGFLKRRTTRIFGQIQRSHLPVQSLPPLGLSQIAPVNFGQARV